MTVQVFDFNVQVPPPSTPPPPPPEFDNQQILVEVHVAAEEAEFMDQD